METDRDRLTALLTRAQSDQSAGAALLHEIYDELRGLARSYFHRLPPNQTLQPTALVNEAYLKLMKAEELQPHDREHFFALLAGAMRQILTDQARKRLAGKRGGDGWEQVTMSGISAMSNDEDNLDVVDLIALDDALRWLGERDARKARVVELRLFGGLSCAQIGTMLDLSTRTIEADWFAARAWLQRELSDGED